MAKILRDIIRIDEELCDGCGLCVPACAEGAIQIIDGKARLVKESFCDGLGACLGECPRGAITIEKREAEPFDEEAVEEHLRFSRKEEETESLSCPSCCEISLEKGEVAEKEAGESAAESISGPASELGNWPIQLKLVSSEAKFLQRPHLVIAADCVPFAFADFHNRFLKGKTLLIGCPKLDDSSFYYHKLVEIFRKHAPEKITVLIMQVPCCSGLLRLVAGALREAGRDVPVENFVIGVGGEILTPSR